MHNTDRKPGQDPAPNRPALDAYADRVASAQMIINGNGW